MKNNPILLILAVLLPLLSCVKEKGLEAVPEDVSAKIVRLGKEVSEESFLVKFTQAPSEEQLRQLESEKGVVVAKSSLLCREKKNWKNSLDWTAGMNLPFRKASLFTRPF